MYQQLSEYPGGPVRTDIIQRVADKAFIPTFDELNMDYQDYLAWVAEGNTILPPE